VHVQQTVVDWGPYRWVRHPSYSGLIIFFCGAGLALTNSMSLPVLAVLPTAALVIRVRIEEDALAGGLGEAYLLYAAPRKRLFPGVW
jgi:protein-S-isoprenylcysteine O-methyltransferase Ste14